MKLLIEKKGIALECDDILLRTHKFDLWFNNAVKLSIIRINNIYKNNNNHKNKFSVKLESIIISFVNDIVKYISDSEVKADSEALRIVLISYINKDKKFQRLLRLADKLINKKDLLKLFEVLNDVYNCIYLESLKFCNQKETFFYLQQFLDRNRRIAMKKFSKLDKISVKEDRIKFISELIKIDPLGKYYIDLIREIDDFQIIDDILVFCGDVDSGIYASVAEEAALEFYNMNKKLMNELFDGEKFDELDDFLNVHFWFEKEDFLHHKVNDFLLNNTVNSQMIDDFVVKLKKYETDPERIPGFQELLQLSNIFEKVGELANPEIYDKGMDYVRMIKLLKYARAFELRDSFFDRFLYSGLLTSTVGCGFISMFSIYLISFIILRFIKSETSGDFILIQSIVSFSFGAMYGFVEWLILFRERSAWFELTDNGRVSLYKVSSEIENFYNRYINMK